MRLEDLELVVSWWWLHQVRNVFFELRKEFWKDKKRMCQGVGSLQLTSRTEAITRGDLKTIQLFLRHVEIFQ